MPDARRSSSHARSSFTEGVAARVIAACRREDPAARITYVGRDEHQRTRVRVRTGGGASVQALQRALSSLMPYATVRASEDVMDGSAQAEIVVPTKQDEYNIARNAASSRVGNRTLAVVACSLGLIGVGMWMSEISNDVRNI